MAGQPKGYQEKRQPRRPLSWDYSHPHGFGRLYTCISWEIDGQTVETVSDFIFWGSKILQMVTAAMKLKDAYSFKGKL